MRRTPRPIERIQPLLDLIKRYWSDRSDLRLGQLVHSLTKPNEDVFYLEDSLLEERLRQKLEAADASQRVTSRVLETGATCAEALELLDSEKDRLDALQYMLITLMDLYSQTYSAEEQAYIELEQVLRKYQIPTEIEQSEN